MTQGPLEKFENQLERLEAAVQADEPLSVLCQVMLEALLPLLHEPSRPSTVAVDLWLNQSDRVNLMATTGAGRTAGRSDDERILQEQIRSATKSRTPILVRGKGPADPDTAEAGSRSAASDMDGESALISACRLSEYHDLVAILRFEDSRGEQNQPGNEQPERMPLLRQALMALTGCVAERVSRILLTNVVQRQQDQAAISDIVRLLQQAGDVQEAADILSINAVRVLGHGRVSILQPQGSGSTDRPAWEVISITGAAKVRQDSEVIQNLQLLAAQMQVSESLTSGVIPWHSTAVTSNRTDADPASQNFNNALAWFGAVGVSELAMLPLKFDSESENRQSVLLMVIELFEVTDRPSDSLVRVLTEETQLILRALKTSRGQLKRRSIRSRLKIIASILAVSFLLLWLIPADFHIKAEGQLFPQERRRLFAPDQGVVDEVLVSADETVESGQVLLRLRNSERDLELNRLQGEHESARTRLQAIRTSRSIGTGPGSVSQGRSVDLSGEEQQWQQRLRNLDAEIELLREQISALTITAPISGIIFQHRLHERLAGRPVQRGQLLLELMQIQGAWQLELQIRDADRGYLPTIAGSPLSAVAASNLTTETATSDVGQNVRVQFVVPSAPGFQFSTELKSVDSAMHLHNGTLSCLAIAEVKDLPQQIQRPGSAVAASIHCGKRSLGFVWFREVIEFWQRKKFSWL